MRDEMAESGSAPAILTTLRDEILEGSLPPGSRLGEVALAARFAVSRGPVREALRGLVDLGLARLIPNAGVRVREIDRAEAAALYELRAALEAEAARLAAERAEQAEFAALERLLSDHAARIAAHPEGAYLQDRGDRDFHIALARMARNAPLARLLGAELYPQLILLRRQHRHIRGRGAAALAEHHRIAAALADRDGTLAALLMRRHIEKSWQALADQIAAPEGATDEETSDAEP
ncbi:GntR family transcriptional regulator [Thioclava sp. BHET1]|nr:GntR family transcriptional regulator [Thioclava sp. BHET1]